MQSAKYCLEKRGLLPTATVAPASPVRMERDAANVAIPNDGDIRDRLKIVCVRLTRKLTEKPTPMSVARVLVEIAITSFRGLIVRRKNVLYYVLDGDKVMDSKGKMLTKLFFQTIKERFIEIMDTEYSTLQQQVQKIASEGRAGYVDITAILQQSGRLIDIRTACEEASNGSANELVNSFNEQLLKNLAP